MFSQIFKWACCRKPQTKLCLANFNENRKILDDTWNHVPNGEVDIIYNDKITGDWVANINYRIKSGQIGLLFVDSKYHRRGLGREILTNAISHIREVSPETRTVWAITSDNHSFWSQIEIDGKKFYHRPSRQVHQSVTGSGYVYDL
jgi:GNAT superfamily N-acetyltransferase